MYKSVQIDNFYLYILIAKVLKTNEGGGGVIQILTLINNLYI